MPTSVETRRRIFDRTDGYCHLCHKRLCFNGYGCFDLKGCWEIEHSVARFSGGTDRLNNKYAACISCNRSKQHRTTRSVRGKNGVTRAPRSKATKAEVRSANRAVGVALGIAVGTFGGPLGMLVGGVIGSAIGNSMKPHK